MKQNVSCFSKFPWSEHYTHLLLHRRHTQLPKATKQQHTIRSQYNYRSTNSAVFVLAVHRSFSFCDHVGGGTVREVQHSSDQGEGYRPCHRQRRRGKTRKSTQEVSHYAKLPGHSRLPQSPSCSSMENFKSCNRDMPAQFCKICFPQCLHKHSRAISAISTKLAELPLSQHLINMYGTMMQNFCHYDNDRSKDC